MRFPKRNPKMPIVSRVGLVLMPLVAGLSLPACTPSVRLEAPREPIEFNVNINITQEVRVKIDRELEEAFKENPELFGLPGSTEE